MLVLPIGHHAGRACPGGVPRKHRATCVDPLKNQSQWLHAQGKLFCACSGCVARQYAVRATRRPSAGWFAIATGMPKVGFLVQSGSSTKQVRPGPAFTKTLTLWREEVGMDAVQPPQPTGVLDVRHDAVNLSVQVDRGGRAAWLAAPARWLACSRCSGDLPVWRHLPCSSKNRPRPATQHKFPYLSRWLE